MHKWAWVGILSNLLTGEETEFVVEWAGHFRNQFHDDNFLLNEIEVFPLQFSQVQDDGILATEK